MKIRPLLLPIPLLAACGGDPHPSLVAPTSPLPSSAPATTAPVASAQPPVTLRAPHVDPKLIPRELLFGNQEQTGPQISPDGRWIAFEAPVDGVLNVVVAPSDDFAKATPLTHEKSAPVPKFTWSALPGVLLYAQDSKGDGNSHVYSVAAPNGTPKDLTPYEHVTAEVKKVSWRHPDEILVSMNDRDPKHQDLYRVNLKTGGRSLVQKNDGYRGFVVSEDLKVALAVKSTPDGGKIYYSAGPKNAFDSEFMRVSAEDVGSVGMHGVDDTGRTVYVQDTRGRDTAALFAMDLATKRSTLLAEDPKADVDPTPFFHPRTKKPILASSTYERPRHIILDKSFEADEDYLRTVVPGADFTIDTCSIDLRRCTVSFVVSDGPVRFYVYDRTKHKADFLYAHRPKLEGLPLAKMTSFVIPSRDGLPLVSYLTLPVGTDPHWAGKKDHALPMVLVVHPGPGTRDGWGFNAEHQWLANRGYAALSVNFRGSKGFGKRFQNAGDLEWGGKMQDDLIDAVDWAVNGGIADAKRVAVSGGSYGGYATLVGLTFTPELFACGVDAYGPSNLLTLEDWILDTMAKSVGDRHTEAGRQLLSLRSPIARADAITRPLLVGQGANDPAVKQAQSDEIVSRLKAKGVPVTYVLFSDEGHEFERPENVKAFHAVEEAFLAQCLGGSYEPVGGDFTGSTVAVPEGGEQVYGLTKALEARKP